MVVPGTPRPQGVVVWQLADNGSPMTSLTIMLAAALFASTGLCVWAAVIARTRRGVPGGSAFGWMMLAVAFWSFTSAMHALVTDFDTRILIAKLQYLAVAPIGVLWIVFATTYGPKIVDLLSPFALPESAVSAAEASVGAAFAVSQQVGDPTLAGAIQEVAGISFLDGFQARSEEHTSELQSH